MADIYDFLKELAKIDIEFQDENGNFHFLKSYIKRLEDSSILIDSPTCNNNTTYHIPVGQSISIGIRTTDGIYVGDSKVIGKELSSISGIVISYPVCARHIQRRQYLRIPLTLDAEITIFEDSDKNNKKVQKVKLRDISGNGFSYVSDIPLTKYYDITCKIDLNDGISPVSSRCEHIYSRESRIHHEHKFIHAFVFTDISPKDVERIVKMSFKYQVELRKKGFTNEL